MDELIKIYKALSDENRIRILKMLELKKLCVCEIKEILQLATSTVSKHLSILRNANLIKSEKDGKWVNYILNDSEKDELVQIHLKILSVQLTEDKTIIEDKKLIETTDRNIICNIYEEEITNDKSIRTEIRS